MFYYSEINIAKRWRYFPLMLLSVAVLQAQGGDSNDNKSRFYEYRYSEGLPFLDTEFIQNYLEFVQGKVTPTVICLFIVCIILGLVGNACLIYFFGNKSSHIYFTRDAIYLHQMSIIDLIICGFILPYTIFFEARMVNYNGVCKVMEYMRHSLTIISHLYLATYSFEYIKKDNYKMAKKRLYISRTVIVGFSMLVTIPVLLVFEVCPNNSKKISEYNLSQPEDSLIHSSYVDPTVINIFLKKGLNPTNSYVLFNPTNFCHMTLSIDPYDDNFEIKKKLKLLIAYVYGFIYFMYIAVFVYNIIQYLDSKPLLGRKSAFVQVIELKNPEISTILSEIERKKHERRHLHKTSTNGRQRKLSVASKEKDSLVNVKKGCQERMHVDINGQTSQSVITKPYTDVDNYVTDLLTNKIVGVRSSDEVDLSSYIRIEQLKSSDIVQQTYRTDDIHRQLSNLDRKCPSCDQEQVSLMMFLCGCECFKSRPKSIRKLCTSDVSKKRASYKKWLMWLFLVDILILSTAFLAYLISGEQSLMLNLVHFKSIFSFYLLSVFKEEVRRATWGESTCCSLIRVDRHTGNRKSTSSFRSIGTARQSLSTVRYTKNYIDKNVSANSNHADPIFKKFTEG